MSLQDDYFDLKVHLEETSPEYADALENIWNAFCEAEVKSDKFADKFDQLHNNLVDIINIIANK